MVITFYSNTIDNFIVTQNLHEHNQQILSLNLFSHHKYNKINAIVSIII